jgi:hypothetical protein
LLFFIRIIISKQLNQKGCDKFKLSLSFRIQITLKYIVFIRR